MVQKPTIAAFDFDGTITKKDTFLDFLIFTFGFWHVFLKSFWLATLYPLVTLELVSRGWFKEKVFFTFFADWEIKKFDAACWIYAKKRTLSLIRKEIQQKVIWHQKQGHQVVIVSASIEALIKAQAVMLGIDEVIGTLPEARNGKLTGKLQGFNCYGREKSKRFLAHYPNRQGYELYAYGNSRGDQELLALADHKFFKSF